MPISFAIQDAAAALNLWLSITPEEMKAARVTHAAFFQNISAYPEHLYNGHRIVMVIDDVYSRIRHDVSGFATARREYVTCGTADER